MTKSTSTSDDFTEENYNHLIQFSHIKNNTFNNGPKCEESDSCESFIRQDLLEIAVNDINVSISFVWPLENDMPRKNRERIAIYSEELKRHHFVSKYRSNSVTFEFDADEVVSSPALGFFAQKDMDANDRRFNTH